MALLGVYVGNDRNQFNNFEKWLGDEVDGIHAVVGSASWSDFVSSAKWMTASLWSGVGRDLFWSVPLLAGSGANLYSAANGDYNQYYKSVAQTLANATPGSDPIYVRTGWEFNGDWFPWSAIGKEQAFIGAFQEFVDTFRSVSNRFKFEWNVNESYGGMDPAKAYPGDKYVDVIGMDFYWNTKYNPKDPVTAWNQVVNEKYGLQWQADFAKAHGKPMAFSEWGVMSDAASPYVKAAKQWIDSHNVLYHSYWDSNDAFPGKLSDNSDPSTGATFKSAFAGSGGGNAGGNTGGSGGGATTPPVTPTPTTPDTSGGGGDAVASAAPTKDVWGNYSGITLYGTDANENFSARGTATMQGGKGDDTFNVTSNNDRVIEYAGGGTDTVRTWIKSYTLPDQVENLTFFGYGASNGTGNGQSNILIGNDGANILDGRGGKDVLTGGKGSDTFVISKGNGRDTITDFAHGADKIQLSGFGGGARLSHSGDVFTVHASDGSETSFVVKGTDWLGSSDYVFG